MRGQEENEMECMIDVSRIKVPDKLQAAIQDCKLCRTARLCMAYCCPKHLETIRQFIKRTEAKGDCVRLKGE